MKYLDEYRDAALTGQLAREIYRITTRSWNIMEVCGGQTHSIVKFGLDELLPPQVHLIHGPGCPVCVTPTPVIDKAIEIAATPGVIFCSFGDMLRVPGTGRDLLAAKAHGGDVRIVYSPLDAVRIATQNPAREVVFLAVGFETTAPATAMAVEQAAKLGLKNFSMVVSHVLVPPALEALLAAPDCRVQGFLAAGHVCTVMGCTEYEALARKHRVPIVVTGFEPVDLLKGVLSCVRQLEGGTHEAINEYARAVRPNGNESAQALIQRIFTVSTREWRGLGEIPQSGLRLRDEFSAFDAELRFGKVRPNAKPDAECRSGLVLQGNLNPRDCPAFGTRCTPEHPLGATMVSSEGACAAYHRYRRAA